MRSYLGWSGIAIMALLGTACLTDTDDAKSDIDDGERAPNPQDLSIRYARDTFAPSEALEPVDEASSAAEAASIRQQITSGPLNLGTNDGRVYNVTAAVNIRSCPNTSCSVLRVAAAGADLPNDGGAGKTFANGYYWIKVVYAFGSSNSCDTTQYKGWAIVDPLSPGNPYVLSGPLNVRQSPCNGTIITSASTGSTLTFYQGDSQWRDKWYEVHVPGNYVQAGWIDGWDFADVR
jgi:hypothetical protein